MSRVWFFVFLAVFGSQWARAQSYDFELINGIAVIVNDKVITMKDVYESTREEEDFLFRRYGNQRAVLEENIKKLRADRVEELVEHQLVLNEFLSLGHPLPDSYVDNRINEEIKRAGGRLTLTKTLQAKGLTFESFRKRIRERIIVQLMWNAKVPPDPVISPSRIEAYYLDHRDKFLLEDRVKLRMIVFTNAASMGVAKEIAQKIDEGASFTEMAKVYSQGSGASSGGDMGWVERKALREELSNAAFKLRPGSRSEPIQLGNNIFLMWVEQSELAHVRSLSEVRQEIEETLKSEETTRLRKQFVDRLRKKSFIRYF